MRKTTRQQNIPRTILGERRRAKILDTAEREFLAKGFVAASVNAIIARAGGSKSSIGQYFKNKAGLFAAVIEVRAASLVDELRAKRGLGTPEEMLQRVGEEILVYMLRKEGLMARRGMYAIGYRHPELPQVFFDSGHAPIVNYIRELLRGWQSEQRIRVDDLLWSATCFIHMLGVGIHEQMLAGLKKTYGRAEVTAEVAAVVQLYWNGIRSFGSAHEAKGEIT